MKVRRRKRSAPQGSSSSSILPALAIGAVAYLLFFKKSGSVGSPLPFTTEPDYFRQLYYPQTDWTIPSGGYNPTNQPEGEIFFNEWGLPTDYYIRRPL